MRGAELTAAGSAGTLLGWDAEVTLPVSAADVQVYAFAAPYTRAYAIAAEPVAGGGLVVAWGGCRDTSLA